MKKHLLRSLFVVLAILAGMPALAQQVTTYDFEDGQAVFTQDSRITVSVVEGTQTIYGNDFELDGKAVSFKGAGNAQNGYSFSHLDFSSLCDQAAKVKVEFEAVLGNGARSIISIGDASVRGNTGNSSKTTYSNKGAIFRVGSDKNNGYVNGDKLAIGDYTQKWLKVSVEVDEVAKTYSYSINEKATGNVIKSAENIGFYSTDAVNCTQLDMFGYINNSQMGLIDNVVITVTKDERQQAEYTVNFLDKNSAAIKEAATRSGAVGEAITLLPADQEPLWNADKTQKYIYQSDNTAGLTIAADGSTTVDIIYRDAEVFSYTLVNNFGTTVATGTGFEGELAYVGYPRYALSDNVFYEADKTNNEYRKTLTLTANNTTQAVTYNAKEGVNAVFFVEGENIEGMTATKTGNVPVRASNALAGTSAEDVTITTLPAGKYIFHVGNFTSKSSYGENVVNFGIGSETFAAGFTNVNLCEVASEEYELTKSTPITFQGTTSWADAQLDYIWIEKTGDVEAAEPTIIEWVAADQGYTNAQDITTVQLDDKTTATFSKAAGSNAPKYYSNGTNVRVYGKNTITFAGEGITKIELTHSNGYAQNLTASTGIYTVDGVVGTWTGNANEIVLTNSTNSQDRITKIRLVYGGEEGEVIVETPKAANIAEALALAVDTEVELTLTNAVVLGSGNNQTIVTDGTGNINLYKTGLAPTVGQKLNGVAKGTYTLYRNMPQLSGDFSEVTVSEDAIVPEAAAVSVAEAATTANALKLVKLQNVTIAAEGNNLYATSGEDKIQVYNTFKANYTLEDGQQLESITGIVIPFNDIFELAPRSQEDIVEAAPVEETVPVDYTAQVSTTWKNKDGNNAGLCATIFAPAVTTADGRNAQMNEYYEGTVATVGELLTQTVEGLENGTYTATLYANAFYTSGRGFDSDVTDGATDVAYVFANDQKAYIAAGITTETSQNGEYTMNVAVTDGTLKLGLGKDKAGTNWHTIQIKSLTLLKPLSEAYATILAEAQEVQGKDMEASVKEALTAAMQAEQTLENYDNTAKAITAAKTSAAAYEEAAAKLANMKQLVDATNVYTEQALNEYYTQWATKYEAKTLTTAEAQALQDPFLVTGWHANITVDNFLLSAWDTNPDFVDAPYYINSWSVEGETDGSEFKVPFFEYWTGDGDSLGEKTLTATMNGLEAGDYEVSAWVRVRAKNGYEAPAYGISLQANDGEAVNVAAGQQVGESQFYLENFTATGTVGQDGVLRIKFNVAADNNISWLSFKNVKFTKVEAGTTDMVSGTIDFQDLCMALGKGGPWPVNDGGDAGFTVNDATMHFLGDYVEQGEQFAWGNRFAYEFVDGRGKFTFRNKSNKKDNNCGMFSWDYAHNFSILGLKKGDKVTITIGTGTVTFVSTNVEGGVEAGANVVSNQTYVIDTEDDVTRLDIQMAKASLITKIVIEPAGEVIAPTISIDRETLALIPGGTQKITATVDPATAETKWVSDNEAVATVAADGTITAVAAGTANVSLQWADDATVAKTVVVTVADVDLSTYTVAKAYDFTTMGDVELTIGDAAGTIWNEANSKGNVVYYVTNEGLEDIAIQAAGNKTGKGWSIVDGEGLYLGSGAGRCAAVKAEAGQVVELIYTGAGFYTGSKNDAVRKDDGAAKTALNESTGRAIYQMNEDGLLGFELIKGNAIQQINIYQEGTISDDEIIKNADFEGTPIVAGICTYDYDTAKNGTELSGMQPVEGWEFGSDSGNSRSAGIFAIGGSQFLGGQGYLPPTAGPNGETKGNVLGLLAVWNQAVQYVQNTTLEAGYYTLTIPVWNAGGADVPEKGLFGFIADNQAAGARAKAEGVNGEYLASAKAYPVNEWTNEVVTFTLNEPTTGKFSLGYDMTNVGSGSAPHLFIGKLTLDVKTLLEGAIDELTAEIAAAEAQLADATQTEGRDAFAAAIEAAKAQLTATDTEAVKAAVAALKVAEDAFVEANSLISEGTYYVYNAYADKFLARGSSWGTRAVVADYGVAVNVAKVADGAYTLQSFDSGAYYGDDYWMYADCTGGRVRNYKLDRVDNGYTLSNQNRADAADNRVYVYMKDDTDKWAVAGNAIMGDNISDEAQTVWQFLTPAEYEAKIAARNAAEKTAAFQAAGIAEDAALMADSEGNVLTFKAGNNWTPLVVRAQGGQPASNEFGTEMWQATGTFSQTVADLPSGLYKVSMQAFYRDGGNDETVTRFETGLNTVLAYVEANGSKAQVKSWAADRVDNGNPNTMAQAAELFAQGKYLSETYAYVGEDGQLNITVSNPAFIGNGWFIADNVTLTKIVDAYSLLAIDPANGSKQKSLQTFQLSMLNGTGVQDIDGEDNVATLTNTTTGTVTQMGISSTGLSAIVFTLNNEPVTELGDYTLTIPAGQLQRTADYAKFPELEYHFTIEPDPLFATGKYYLQNVGNKMFWGAGNDWGTRATLVKHAEYATLNVIDAAANTYTLESQVSNGGTNYYFGGDYMDGQPATLTIAQLENGNYTIAQDGNFFGYDGTSTVLGKGIDATTENGQWQIFSEEQMQATLSTATQQAPVDATFLILDPRFGRNNRNVGAWSVSSDCTNSNLTGGNSNKHCAESYHSTFTVQQAIDAPNGVYSFTAQGFYRQDGSDNDNLPAFFINNETAPVPLKTGTENSMADACASFENGLYEAQTIYVEVEDGKINLGVKNEQNANLWVIWDNFELTYYGTNADIDELKFGAALDQLAALRAEAERLKGEVEIDAVSSALANALTATANVAQNEQAIAAALQTLQNAVDKGQASERAKNVLPKMELLVKGTNFYTQEALNAYYTQWASKYEAGTLTKAEADALQDPFLVTGWHASITVDDLLLSVWDTNPDFVDAPYYINTWSVEGETDGSDFKVPFFEYWTGDAESLGEKTLTATLDGMQPGVYNVSAWVRVRAKNGYEAPAYGVTMQVADGEAVNVAAGQQVGSSQFFLDSFTAKGKVGNDGVLTLKFNVAADNNISWLSFKNAEYVFDAVGTGILNLNANKSAEGIYNLNGQKVERTRKGLYIQNGKKVVVK